MYVHVLFDEKEQDRKKQSGAAVAGSGVIFQFPARHRFNDKQSRLSPSRQMIDKFQRRTTR